MGDVPIIITILTLLILMGIFLPIAEYELGYVTRDYNATRLMPLNPEAYETNYTGWYSAAGDSLHLIRGMGRAFVWTWDWFPFWLVALHVVIRIALALLIYRQIRSGGG